VSQEKLFAKPEEDDNKIGDSDTPVTSNRDLKFMRHKDVGEETVQEGSPADPVDGTNPDIPNMPKDPIKKKPKHPYVTFAGEDPEELVKAKTQGVGPVQENEKVEKKVDSKAAAEAVRKERIRQYRIQQYKKRRPTRNDHYMDMDMDEDADYRNDSAENRRKRHGETPVEKEAAAKKSKWNALPSKYDSKKGKKAVETATKIVRDKIKNRMNKFNESADLRREFKHPKTSKKRREEIKGILSGKIKAKVDKKAKIVKPAAPVPSSHPKVSKLVGLTNAVRREGENLLHPKHKSAWGAHVTKSINTEKIGAHEVDNPAKLASRFLHTFTKKLNRGKPYTPKG
jgi:hypothetical protein